MKAGTKLRYKDGRVGSYRTGSKTVVLPTQTVDEMGITVAGLEEVPYDKELFEDDWLEGPDEHNRYWDGQTGRQVVFHPDGKKELLE